VEKEDDEQMHWRIRDPSSIVGSNRMQALIGGITPLTEYLRLLTSTL